MANNIKSTRLETVVNRVLRGGLSFDNDYSFSIEISKEFRDAFQRAFPETFENNGIGNVVYDYNIGQDNRNSIKSYLENDASIFKFGVLCDEISLPGISTATGFIKGASQGQTLTYAHTKLYNSVSISFLCDRDMTALKFFQFWVDWIHPSVPSYQESNVVTGSGTAINLKRLSETPNYSASTRYFEDYAFTFDVYKMETKYSPQSISVRTRLFDAFPSKISAIPLNSGASSIARVTVDITYGRHTTNFEKFTDKEGILVERYYGIS